MTCGATSLATWMAAEPTPPAAPWISTVSPGCSRARFQQGVFGADEGGDTGAVAGFERYGHLSGQSKTAPHRRVLNRPIIPLHAKLHLVTDSYAVTSGPRRTTVPTPSIRLGAEIACRRVHVRRAVRDLDGVLVVQADGLPCAPLPGPARGSPGAAPPAESARRRDRGDSTVKLASGSARGSSRFIASSRCGSAPRDDRGPP